MDRKEVITKGISKDMRGIEIGPSFNPLTPKREGFNCLVMDVFEAPTLRARGKDDPNVPNDSLGLIEDVDFVGSATEIADRVPASDHGTFDYIVSSHNFEHLPNPIRFLQGCQKVLKPGGLCSFAVPDARGCFDYFRPHTTTIDWLSAYAHQRAEPTREQIFAFGANFSMSFKNAKGIGAFLISDDPSDIQVTGDLKKAYQDWVAAAKTDKYSDVHCTVMTPASLELLIAECQFLGLISLRIESISEPVGCEFYVRFINKPPTAIASSEINKTRSQLMRRIWEERAAPTLAKLAVKSASGERPKSQSVFRRFRNSISKIAQNSSLRSSE